MDDIDLVRSLEEAIKTVNDRLNAYYKAGLRIDIDLIELPRCYGDRGARYDVVVNCYRLLRGTK